MDCFECFSWLRRWQETGKDEMWQRGLLVLQAWPRHLSQTRKLTQTYEPPQTYYEAPHGMAASIGSLADFLSASEVSTSEESQGRASEVSTRNISGSQDSASESAERAAFLRHIVLTPRIAGGRSQCTVLSEPSCYPVSAPSCESFGTTCDLTPIMPIMIAATRPLPTLLTGTTFPTWPLPSCSGLSSVEEVFKAFCGARVDMDGKSFAKLCKDCGIIDRKLSSGDVDLIFAKVSPAAKRRICLDLFLVALTELARKKEVHVDAIHLAVTRSAGPVIRGTKADAVRFHDDKSTYTGTHVNGGPEVGGKGPGCFSRRQLTNISYGAAADPTFQFATDLQQRILEPPAVHSMVDTFSVGHRRSPSSSAEDGSLDDTFRAYCNHGELMDGKSFAKLCKDCNLIGQGFTETDVDLIFAKFKVRNFRHLDILKFKGALRFLASKKGVDIDTIFSNVSSCSGPLLTGTKVRKVRFFDDAPKSRKTTEESGDELSWRQSLRPEHKQERLPRFVAQRVGDLVEPMEEFNTRSMMAFQRERRRLRDSVKTRPPLDTDEVTMVFTDVQGSTSLWEANPKAMEQALRLHDATIRLNVAKHDGYEVTTEGDAFQVVFHDAFDAVGFCLDVQSDLLRCDWPEETLKHPDAGTSIDGAWRGLRVRMGMHSGRPLPPTKHEMTGRSRYAGRSVAIAKAVEEVCEGGQILVSCASFSQINGLLTQLQSPQVVDCGAHTLEAHGVADAESQVRLLQLVPAALAHDHFSCSACSVGVSSCCIGGRVFPPPTSKHCVLTTQGFHSAPAAALVTLCFVFTNGARDLVASDPFLAVHALGMLRRCVRELLTGSGRSGYECQEDEGAFMLAFPSLSETAAFASALQRELAQLPWQDELRACSPAFAEGLRVGIGALHGSYTSRGPHATTGRADYFGTIVNRTARIAAAAHAGQVLLGVDPSVSSICTVAQAKQSTLCKIEGCNRMHVQLPHDAVLERLGAFAFKGIEGPLAVHELRTPRIDGEFESFPEPKCKGRVGC